LHFWGWGPAVGFGLLALLRQCPFRRSVLRPTGRADWVAAPHSKSATLTLDAVRSLVDEVRSSFPFHGMSPAGLDHPAAHLDSARLRLLRESTTAVGCATYSSLLADRLAFHGVETRLLAFWGGTPAQGHVALEAYLPNLGGWILLDTAYSALFRGPEGRFLSALEVRSLAAAGVELWIEQTSSGEADPHTQSEKLLGVVMGGILDRMVAYPYLAPGGSRVLFRGRAFSEGGFHWAHIQALLQGGVLLLAIALLVALLAAN